MTKTLLVADDSVTIQKVIALTFSGEDVVIEGALNGDEAMQKVRSMRPDIVLADVFMPGLNGYELCAEIKSDPSLIDTRVILLVGTFEPFDSSEASRVKCDAYITKPFDTEELTELVRSFAPRAAQSAPEVVETDIETVQGVTPIPERSSGSDRLVSARARASFLGDDRILDILDPRSLEAPKPVFVTAEAIQRPPAEQSEDSSSSGEPVFAEVATGTSVVEAPPADPVGAVTLSDEVLDSIVERVIRRMSREVVREVAWEVIPELAETIVRQCFDERRGPGSQDVSAPHRDLI
jgi:CheY-like chemotaxis protein